MEFDAYPLGDGRVAYATGDGGSDWGVDFGTLSDEDGVTTTTAYFGRAFYRGHLIATNDSGLVMPERDPGGDGDGGFEMTQLDADGGY